MSEIQTTEEVTETTEPVTLPENTEEIAAPEETAPSEVVEPAPIEPETTEPTPQEDPYKKKFVESQREGILLNERLNIEKAKTEQLIKSDTPTDEIMKQLYPEWDVLDEYNKKVLIRTEAANIRSARIELELANSRAERQLEEDLDNLLESPDPKFSKLKGKESEFKRFAKRPANKGIKADILAQAFLFDVEDEPQVTKVPKSEALPQGSGGDREEVKPSKISLEEAAKIRATDNNRYMELVKAGKIDTEI